MKQLQYSAPVAQSASRPPILLDIMQDGRFLCQLRYTKRGFPRMINGKIVEVYDQEDIEKFVLEQRPSLRDKNITIELANQKVFAR